MTSNELVLFPYGESQDDISFDTSLHMDPSFLWGVEREAEAEETRRKYHQPSPLHAQLVRQADLITCSYCQVERELFSADNKPDVRMCPACGWWSATCTWNHWESMVSAWETYSRVSVARLRGCDVGKLSTPYEAAKQHLALGHAELGALHARHAEQLVVDFLRERMDCSLELTRTSRDGGYDILGFDSNLGRFLVEVKRYNSNVGVSVVRAFLGVLFREGMCRGILVSVASSFSAEAQEEVKAVGQEGRQHVIDMELVDVEEVAAFLERAGSAYRSERASPSAISSRVEHVRKIICEPA